MIDSFSSRIRTAFSTRCENAAAAVATAATKKQTSPAGQNDPQPLRQLFLIHLLFPPGFFVYSIL